MKSLPQAFDEYRELRSNQREEQEFMKIELFRLAIDESSFVQVTRSDVMDTHKGQRETEITFWIQQ